MVHQVLTQRALEGYCSFLMNRLMLSIRNLDGSPAGLAIQSAMNNGTLLKALSYVDKATNELKIVQLGVAKNK